MGIAKIGWGARAAQMSSSDLFGPGGTPRVIVVGAGFGGIGVGVKLKKAGIDTFTLYESSLGVGGTWWDNTYPGAEVDVNSNLYCYSFKSQEWTRTHAQQSELQKYLEETVDEFELRRHLQLGVAVVAAAWDDERHMWAVTLDSGAVDEGHVLVSAVGFLNIPRYPEWPGLADFAGPKFHTSRFTATAGKHKCVHPPCPSRYPDKSFRCSRCITRIITPLLLSSNRLANVCRNH